MRKKIKSYLLIVSIVFLSGCMVGPNYKKPESQISGQWASICDDDAMASQTPIIQWWEQLEDPLLNQYMDLAAQYNRDVLAATERILQARGLRQMDASSFWPQIGVDLNATKTYFSKNGPIFAIGPSVGNVPGTLSSSTGLPFTLQTPQIQSLYNVLFDATWEIDLFGKTRRKVEAANAFIESNIEQRNDVLITVLAEIGRNYIELRGSQERAELILDEIELIKQKAQLFERQFEVGRIGRLDIENIRARLATERSKLPDIYAQIYQSIYAISVLTGSYPEKLLAELLPYQPLPKFPGNVTVGLQSDLLRRRPDVRRAERELAMATANEGVAVAEFFPTFTLVGDGGLQSLALKNLFSLGSKTWAIGGDMNMPIFMGGKLKGNLSAKRAATAAIAHTYQQTILRAIEEAESVIISYTQDLNALYEREMSTSHYQASTRLSDERFQKGLVSLIDVINAKSNLNASEQELLNTDMKTLLDTVLLYKVLGGGWEQYFPEPKHK